MMKTTTQVNRQNQLDNRALFISCVVPVFNEQDIILDFLQQLIAQLVLLTDDYEIILVDDGSRDNTVEKILSLAANKTIKLICFSRNFGKEFAITAGLEHVHGQVMIILDSDLQHPLAVIPQFIQQWAAGYDMVYGVRQNRETESVFKRNMAKLFYNIMQILTKTDLLSHAGDFRLLDCKVGAALKQCDERNRFMKGLYGWVGYRSIGVPYFAAKRARGKSGWGISKLTELAITGITSFSSIPLRIWGVIGFIISAIALCYAAFIVLDTLIYGVDLKGFATIVVAIMFFGGIQLLSIGILGEYIGRIFDEVKQRPKYIIAQKFGFEESND